MDRYRSRVVGHHEIVRTEVPSKSTWPTNAEREQEIITLVKNSPPITTQVPIVQEMWDSVTPGYFGKKRRGEPLPTVKMRRREFPSGSSIKFSYGAAVRFPSSGRHGVATRNYSANLRFDTVTPPALLSPSQINEAAIRAKAKIHSLGMQYGVTAMEFGKTVAMLLEAKKKLQKNLIKTIRAATGTGRNPRFFTDLNDLSKVIQDYWLEARFGWRILYYDVRDLYTYVNTFHKEPALVVGRDRLSSTKKSSRITGGYELVSYENHTVHVGFPGMIDYGQPGNFSIAHTAWDLASFTLLIDMFFAIEERLLLLSNPTNVELLPASNFLVDVREVEYFLSPIHTAGSFDGTAEVLYVNTDNPVGPLKVTHVERSIPSPSILTWPELKYPLGFQRLDVLALLRPLYGALRGR